MKFSNSKSDKKKNWIENCDELSGDFDYDELDDGPLFKGEFGKCLRDAVNNYLCRQMFNMFLVYESMTVEERKALFGRKIFHKSFREIGREINRDKKTVQSRYDDAIFRIKNSPLMKVIFERKRRED